MNAAIRAASGEAAITRTSGESLDAANMGGSCAERFAGDSIKAMDRAADRANQRNRVSLCRTTNPNAIDSIAADLDGNRIAFGDWSKRSLVIGTSGRENRVNTG